MAPAGGDAPKAPAVVERFVRQLIVAAKAAALYPPASKIPAEATQTAVALLGAATREFPELRIFIDKNGLYFADAPLSPGQLSFTGFAQDLYHHHLASVTFHEGAAQRDLLTFLTVLKSTPEELHASGGFAANLWSQNVSAITVAETQVILVEAEVFSAEVPELSEAEDGAEVETTPVDPEAIDIALERVLAGHSRERRAIARVIGEPATVRRYLETVYRAISESDVNDALEAVAQRFSEFAQVAQGSEGKDGARDLSEALAGLEPELRRQLLTRKILPEARTSDAMAEVVRQLGADEILRILVEDVSTEDLSEEALIDAVRCLSAVLPMERTDLADKARAAMLGAGFSAGLAETLVDLIAPTRLVIRGEEEPQAAGDDARPADVIARIMDLDLSREPLRSDDTDVLALREEARLGITGGDVISTLVLMATLDVRETEFASTMALLEDSLSVLISRGDVELATRTAVLMRAAAGRPELAPVQRQRLEQAVERFSRPEDVRTLAHALRLFAPGTVEHASARELLGMLGPLATDALLELLAAEPDMAARRVLVELLSGISGNTLQLAPRLSDPRWYFVRNVVSILGAGRSPEVLPLLERTLRHPDARVRRETIRALSGIPDRVSTNLLVLALSDADGSNVQLAARFIGASGASSAVGALEAVARGEGSGNRENGPRIEAIDALGRLGATEAVPTLEHLARARSLFGASRTRELRTAAESAIAKISAKKREVQG
ncbi:MAG: HEAT repeat domain-containing protein [Coriobacteriia bacterium]|nr:HEAT repeat domain-containing protein [Coriobacteriia bacterium]